MTEFNGIPINEGKLLLLSIIFTAVAIGLIVLGIFWLKNVIEDFRPDRSNRRRIEEIIARGADDPKVQKRLKKLERKQKKLQKERRKTILEDSLIGLLIVGALVIDLALCVIPGWSDYIVKDYVVYEGEFEVVSYTRNHYIILEDGTRLDGSVSLPEGEYEGKVVYTKRAEIALGAIKEKENSK